VAQVEREYIKITQHEEITREKHKLIERLKQELENKEMEYRQDINNKLRNLDHRLKEELEEKEKLFKSILIIRGE